MNAKLIFNRLKFEYFLGMMSCWTAMKPSINICVIFSSNLKLICVMSYDDSDRRHVSDACAAVSQLCPMPAMQMASTRATQLAPISQPNPNCIDLC